MAQKGYVVPVSESAAEYDVWPGVLGIIIQLSLQPGRRNYKDLWAGRGLKLVKVKRGWWIREARVTAGSWRRVLTKLYESVIRIVFKRRPSAAIDADLAGRNFWSRGFSQRNLRRPWFSPARPMGA